VGAFLLLVIVIGGWWFFSQARRERRRGKAESDLKEAISKVRVTVSTGPFPENAKREEWKKERLADAVKLIVPGTGLPTSIHADLHTALLIDDRQAQWERLSQLLTLDDWSWPWFERHYPKFIATNTWPYMWGLWEERPKKPSTVKEVLAVLAVEDIREVLRAAGKLPSPQPKGRVAWDEYVLKNCTVETFEPIIGPRFEATLADWTKRFRRDKAILLMHSILTLGGNLVALDEASEMEPQYGEPNWRQMRAKVVADTLSDMDPLFRSFAREFNRGKILPIPPWFPGDTTGLEATVHSESPRTGRYIDQIPLTRWEPLDLDFTTRRVASEQDD
jgi:hypothetical protein